ncbi:MAG: glycosyltransferase family 4 protein [Sarcina sp.]
MKTVIFIRSNPVMPDPRVEKEVISLVNKGYKVNILAWNRECLALDSKENKELNNHTNFIWVNIQAEFSGGFKKNIIPLLKFQVAALKYLFSNRNKYDIIHCCDFDTVLLGYIMKKVYGKKYIYDIFDFYIDAFNVPKKLKNFIKKIDFHMINNSDATIICTEKRKEQINGSKPKNLYVIHNSPKYEQLSSIERKVENEKIKLVYIGILSNDRFLEEICKFVIEQKNYELHIGGFGCLEDKIKKFSEDNNNIIFYGKVMYKRVLEIESRCDILLAIYNPSIRNHRYSAPNKFYEALMLGKPIIMAKNTGMDDIIQKYNIGYCIDYNQKSLKKALKDILVEKEEWKMKKELMQNLYKRKYSWEIMDGKLDKIYRSMEET